MKKVLILGHKGMLGNAVYSYLDSKKDKYTLLTVSSRFGTPEFTKALQEIDADYIINCIGIIPQKKPKDEEYKLVNIDLPVFLESLGKNIIHPSTDCEFKGTIPKDECYTKTSIRDADDIYGKSKRDISERIEETFTNTKIIRTSIIGHEQGTSLALLDWFLSQEGAVNGYTNHYWNGITTLMWAKLAEELMDSWEKFPVLNQYGLDTNISKYEIVTLVKEVYGKTIEITPFETPLTVNKCLTSDKKIPSLKEQLLELKHFYNK